MNIRQQSEAYLESLQSRRRNPIKPRTLKAYSSYLRTWIVPLVGAEDLATFENGAMRKFVAKLAEAELAPATTVGVVNCLKGVVGSVLDDNGNEMFPRKWNNEFMDLPLVVQRDQKAPVISRAALETAISRAQGVYKPLYATLAGTGLRIGECLALQAGPDDGRGTFWVRESRMILVRGQMQNGQFLSPKTAAGYRKVDVSDALNDILAAACAPVGHVFDIPVSTAYEAAEKDGIPGFHSLRRFRTTRLREVGTPEDILKFWIGHGSKDITDRYSKLASNEALRKEWAEKAGLGFSIGD